MTITTTTPTRPTTPTDPTPTDPSEPDTGRANETSSQSTDPTRTEPIDINGCRLLIVDDNAQNVELLQAYLDTLPCQTEASYDGQQAIARVEAEDQPAVDLILLDVMMPRMSGFEVCRRLKAQSSTSQIPVLMVTALNEIGDIERGVESGTDDFLSKPVNKLELLTRVKTLLRVRREAQRGDQLQDELARTEEYIRQLERSSNGFNQ